MSPVDVIRFQTPDRMSRAYRRDRNADDESHSERPMKGAVREGVEYAQEHQTQPAEDTKTRRNGVKIEVLESAAHYSWNSSNMAKVPFGEESESVKEEGQRRTRNEEGLVCRSNIYIERVSRLSGSARRSAGT